MNKSLFYKDKKSVTFKDYEGLYTQEGPNRSFDNTPRTRSKSDYYNQNFLNFGGGQQYSKPNYSNFLHANYFTNALNNSNLSTHANEEKSHSYKK